MLPPSHGPTQGELEGPAGGEVEEVPGVVGYELWEVEGGIGLKPPTLDHTQTTAFRQGRTSISLEINNTYLI